MVRKDVKSCMHRYHYLTNRVVKIWKSLSEEIVNSKTKIIFKTKLDI